MGYKIEKDLISGLSNIGLTATKIVVAHESGNPNNTGSNSLNNEINYMKGNWQNAFVSHWVGSGGRIVQIAPVGKVQYGAGSKANPITYAHVEMARTDNRETFDKDYEAYVRLLNKLAKDAGIPVEVDTSKDKGIKSHLWVNKNLGGTTHVDPYGYLQNFGVSKEQFKKDVERGGVFKQPTTPQVDKNTATIKDSAETYATGEKISEWVKGNSYTILQEESDKVLFEDIYSWVRTSDIEGYHEPNEPADVNKGEKVTLLRSAKEYSTGEIIDDRYKNKTYTVQQIKSDKVLLRELYSWVDKSDIKEYGGSSQKPTSSPTISGKVVLKYSSDTYATGENIPVNFKGKTYTIQQDKDDRVLLKELFSWVRKTDISPVQISTPKADFKVGNKATIKDSAERYSTGENIPSRFKGQTYTIQQVESNKVLLKELYSWVRKSDLR